MIRRWTFFAYGVFSHLLFLAVYAAFAGFVGNFILPKSIDSAPADDANGALIAGAIDLGLIALFAVQHSVMARPGFKRRWTKVVPEPIERATYVFISCVLTVLLMWQWRAVGPVIWDVRQPAGRAVIWGVFAVGWLMVPAVSLLINHFDLFGTRQVWLHLKNQSHTTPPFRTPSIYRQIRHPLYVGWAIAFWATPTMTFGHLLFAGALTAYMFVATFFEERDLIDLYGETYRQYQARVPKFIPRLRQPAEATTPVDEPNPVDAHFTLTR